ncbi:MAG: DegT/DnrJ/EryC1/StrS family aminotransferase [Firmicutes bacterium]|nr:DegT/DnrJ/EryC1/StrS family aminotransferase [Bacillota bacterium]MDH7494557.1 DegT/DnrJ/EryC1/StrS family aminotransferase [Bacillota bacterium]
MELESRCTAGLEFRRVSMARPYHGPEVEEAVVAVLRSGMLIQGRLVEEFETRLAEYLGAKHVIAVSSGTAALHLAFLALGVGPGDEVITTPFSFASSAYAIMHCGATPVFADIDPKTFNIDPASIEARITARTVGIEPVHLYGQPAEMDAIRGIAARHGLFVVEDAAQAIGADYRGRKIGTIGDVTCFSTYATKNLHTMEGGFVTTSSDDVAARIRRLRNIGQERKYHHSMVGFNYRMTEVAAAIGSAQVGLIDEFSRLRRENAEYLTAALSSVPGITPPHVMPHVTCVFHQYTTSIDEETTGRTRDEVAAAMRSVGVETGVHYPEPIYAQPALRERFGGQAEVCPVTERACRSVLSLPVHQSLAKDDLDHVVSALAMSVGLRR